MARALRAAVAALLALAALGSCGKGFGGKSGTSGNEAVMPAEQAVQLFPDDFKGACSGASISQASAYDPKAAAHKALFFATYKDDFADHSSSLPHDWTVQYSSGGDPFKAIDLVACARRTAAQEVKICDKYEKDGHPTQNKVRWHNATYQLSLMEAKTGRKLAEKTIEANDPDCPMFENFEGESDIVDDYASLPDTAVADFLRPHITR